MSVSAPNFTKPMLDPKYFVKNSYAEVYKSSTDSLVAYAMSQRG